MELEDTESSPNISFLHHTATWLPREYEAVYAMHYINN